jgi:hypothetical protein
VSVPPARPCALIESRTTRGRRFYAGGVKLADVFHRPLRIAVAGLWLLGAGLAGFSAPDAAVRIDVASGLVFSVVAVAGVVFAVSTLRGRRWALAVGLVGCGGQVFGVVGTTWELVHPLDTAKSRELRALEVDPTLAVTINLVFSAVASALFVWMAIRLFRIRQAPRRSESGTCPR